MSGNATIFPFPVGPEPSDDYELRVDGQEVFVHRCPVASYGTFAVDGPFPVSIIHGCDADHMIEDVTIEALTIHCQPIADANAARMVVELTRGLRFIGSP